MTLTINPFVCLAPMAGITDLPFRQLVQSFGADRVTSEMVASNAMVVANRDMRTRAELGANVEGTAVQLAGREPHWMAEAARIVEDLGARFIDINMGCPAKKVTGGMSGSALMRDLDLAVSLIRAVIQAVSVPVSLKMRLGWDDAQLNASELAHRAEAEGVTLITVHGRTRCQFYTGQADWQGIAPVVDAVNVPVLANGDVVDLASARAALHASNANGVMIGRGAQGAPWTVAQIRAALAQDDIPTAPQGAALTDLISTHYDSMLSFYGQELGRRVARKHLGWYMDRLQTPADIRAQIVTEADPMQVLRLIPDMTEHHAEAA
ncbi:MAG: tRNA dihydrouridine synthase DusB [Deltaproteobacteria bacterium]